jgi:hypothetical protein
VDTRDLRGADYNPGVKVFGWTLFPSKAGRKPDGPMVNGEGTTSKAAKLVCIPLVLALSGTPAPRSAARISPMCCSTSGSMG